MVKVTDMLVARVIALSAVLLVVATTIPQAAAQSSYCLPLQMELAELEKSSGGRSSSNQRAIRRQLDSARVEERRAGCRGLFRRRGSQSTCRAIRSRISSLERQLSGSSGGFFGFGRASIDRRRASIRDALRRNGCSTYAVSSYRTLCVRLCDGYYYPLSNTSTRQRFSQDAEKCASQYGPGQATLFYHPYPSGDASQAVSLDGERYFDQPYAFAYRTQYIPHCAAQLHTGLAALGERVRAALRLEETAQGTPLAGLPPTTLGEQFEAAAATHVEAFSVPVPIARPDWSSDPETLANRAANFVPPRPEAEAATVEIALVGRASRGVGDPYYFLETEPGPPPTVAGYQPPELKDFRMPQRASVLPTSR